VIKSLLYSRHNILPALLPLKASRAITGQRLVMLIYHTVNDTAPDHIIHLYQPRTLKIFTEDMEFLLKHYEPIDLFRLKEIVNNREKPRRNLFFVSFDDGLSEFYFPAAPLLEKMGIPATCFLNTAFVDNRDMFYRYKVSVLIEAIQKHKERKEFWQEFHALKEKHDIPQGYYRNVLLGLNYCHLPFIEEAAQLVRLDFTDYLKSRQPYMTDEQIRELVRKGFTFGGHGVNHADFNLLTEEEKISQAFQSTKEVAERFGLPYRVFSFPFTDFGIEKSFFNAIYANDQIELSFGTAGLKKDSEYRNLQRIPIEESGLSAERRLKADYFYYLLKGLIGQNVIVR
jgi:peptidoglycan/xylan/chitin deacetylase (PgdA/CDA1 family)